MKSVVDALIRNQEYTKVKDMVQEREKLKVHWGTVRNLEVDDDSKYDLTLLFLTELGVLSTKPEGNYIILNTERGEILNPRATGFQLLTYFTRKEDAEQYKKAGRTDSGKSGTLFKISSN